MWLLASEQVQSQSYGGRATLALGPGSTQGLLFGARPRGISRQGTAEVFLTISIYFLSLKVALCGVLRLIGRGHTYCLWE